MTISADVLADSVCRQTGARVTTFLLTYPRFIHQELLTHRVFSRNSASSRAIPVWKILSDVLKNPAVPLRFGAAKKGMQDGGALPSGTGRLARALWLLARYPAVAMAWLLYQLGVHKQITNRLLEPWMHMTVVLTGTEWQNFYRLRYHPAAQPEFQELAKRMLWAHAASAPREVDVGEYHLPFFRPEDACVSGRPDAAELWGRDLTAEILKRCTARCARTSYRNFYGKNDVADDIRLHDQLAGQGHWSPFEHCCQALNTNQFSGNLRGFEPYRKQFQQESGEDGTPFDPLALLKELTIVH